MARVMSSNKPLPQSMSPPSTTADTGPRGVAVVLAAVVGDVTVVTVTRPHGTAVRTVAPSGNDLVTTGVTTAARP
jgi:hypothetical protein